VAKPLEELKNSMSGKKSYETQLDFEVYANIYLSSSFEKFWLCHSKYEAQNYINHTLSRLSECKVIAF
jgi:hypothetical protein